MENAALSCVFREMAFGTRVPAAYTSRTRVECVCAPRLPLSLSLSMSVFLSFAVRSIRVSVDAFVRDDEL